MDRSPDTVLQRAPESLVWDAIKDRTNTGDEMTGTALPKELPLAGVRVIEMTHMVMGPTCGMILAQLGAEVIKVEPPAGDKTRSLGGMGTAFFPLFNRGKRSVVLDFEKAEDRDTMHRLLASADVFLENIICGTVHSRLHNANAWRPAGNVIRLRQKKRPEDAHQMRR